MKNTYRANKRALTCEKIRGYIREQGLRPGSKLPSQREMCALFGVSRQCIHDAVAILVREGTLYTRPRSGQYVGAWPFEVLTHLRRLQSAAASIPQFCGSLHPDPEPAQNIALGLSPAGDGAFRRRACPGAQKAAPQRGRLYVPGILLYAAGPVP